MYIRKKKSTSTFSVWDLVVHHDVKGRPRSRVSTFVVDSVSEKVKPQEQIIQPSIFRKSREDASLARYGIPHRDSPSMVQQNLFL